MRSTPLRSSPPRVSVLRGLAALALLLALALGALAQESAPGGAPPLDVAAIESRLRALGDSPSGASALAAERYRDALVFLSQASEHDERAADLQRLAREAPRRLGEVTSAQVTSEALQISEVSDEGMSLERVRAARLQAAGALREARTELVRLEQESARRSQRRLEIADQEHSLTLRQRAIQAQLAGALEGKDAEVPAASRITLRAEERAIHAELTLLDAERASYEARRELLPARVDFARRRVQRAKSALAAWQDLEARRGREQAEEALSAAAAARKETIDQIPQLRGLAEANHTLAESRTGPEGLSARLSDATAALERRRSELSLLQEQFRVVQRKVDAAGVTRAMGRLLRLQLDRLPDTDALERQVEQFEEDISSVQFELILREEDRRRASTLDQRVEALALLVAEDQRPVLTEAARELLLEERQLLEAVIHEQGLLLERLVALRQATSEQIEVAETTRTYVEERILWVRSVSESPWSNLAETIPATYWLLRAPEWGEAWRQSGRLVLERPWSLFWLVGIVAAVLVRLRVSKPRLTVLAGRAWSKEGDSMLWTLEGLLHTILIALPFPILLWAAADFLSQPPNQVEVSRAWAAGLATAAPLLLGLGFLGALFRHEGLGERHFRWRSQLTTHLRWHLRWYTPLAVTCAFLIGALDRQSTTSWNESLGLLAFVVQMVALTVLVQRILRQRGPLLSSFIQREGESWAVRLRYLWIGGAIGLPASLACFALFGFHYSARLLYLRVEASVALVVILFLVNAVLERWLTLVRLRLVLEEAKQRAAEAAGEESAEGDSPNRAVNQGELGAKTRHLIRSLLVTALVLVLYFVWADVLPALRRLDRVEIYPEFRIAESEAAASDTARDSETGALETNASGEAKSSSEDGAKIDSLTPAPGLSEQKSSGPVPNLERITLADLGLGIMILFLTVLFAKNLPLLLESSLLERLPIDSGLSYAVTTVTRYGIALVGGGMALNMVGIRWESVQWLAAALTFGLAFGLQEIFANFVSGLIILFERPIRVGDAVTVGEVSGTVTRLQMRATTITDWDNKELIIPNKEFVTGQIINWSLSSPHVRLRVPVGIAYGSDTKQAKQIMLEVARNHPRILDTPSPEAYFMEFGDSTLNFELRGFIPHPRHRFTVRHEVLDELNDRFQEAAIEISYPKRDVQLNASQPLLAALAAPAPEDLSPDAEVAPAAETPADADGSPEGGSQQEDSSQAEDGNPK